MACFPRTVYISCNPDTLAANVAALGGSHAVERFAVFDQFPYTHHLECGALLVARSLGGADGGELPPFDSSIAAASASAAWSASGTTRSAAGTLATASDGGGAVRMTG